MRVKSYENRLMYELFLKKCDVFKRYLKRLIQSIRFLAHFMWSGATVQKTAILFLSQKSNKRFTSSFILELTDISSFYSMLLLATSKNLYSTMLQCIFNISGYMSPDINWTNKLCARPHDMPPPLYSARCGPAPAHTRLTPAAPSAPCFH